MMFWFMILILLFIFWFALFLDTFRSYNFYFMRRLKYLRRLYYDKRPHKYHYSYLYRVLRLLPFGILFFAIPLISFVDIFGRIIGSNEVHFQRLIYLILPILALLIVLRAFFFISRHFRIPLFGYKDYGFDYDFHFPHLRTPPFPEIEDLIYSVESETGIILTPEAKQMILIPIHEAFWRGGYDHQELRDVAFRSIKKIVSTMVEEPSSRDKDDGGLRTSTSVIRSFWKNFCNIPPFCSDKERNL